MTVIDDYGSVSYVEKQINVTESPVSAITSYVSDSFWGIGNWTQNLIWHDTADMMKIDAWLRDRDGNGQPDLTSKPFDWLQDPEFSYLQKENETVLIPVLNQEMVAGSNLTYRQTILNIIHEQEMIEKALMQQTPRYPLKIIASLVPGGKKLILNDATLSGIEGILNIFKLGVGDSLVGLYKYGTGLMGIVDLYETFQYVDEWKYDGALSVYFLRRSLGDDSVTAWNFSPKNVLSDQMNSDMLEATQIKFEEWWQKYAVDIKNIYGVDWNANGLPNVFKRDLKGSVEKLILFALEEHKDKLPKNLIVQTYSPVEIHVYDFLGRVAGLVNGEIKEEILNSIYDKENERLMIFAPAGDYHYNFVGTDSGMYKVEIINVQGEKPIYFNGQNIPTDTGVIHEYSIDWNALANNEKGVTLQIDKGGDGVFEQTVNVGAEFSDAVAPTTDISVSGNIGDNEWHISDVQVMLTVQDNDGGVGVEKTEYSMDDGATWNQYSGPFMITEEGKHSLYYRSADYFGNTEQEKSAGIKIDKTKPVLDSSRAPEPNSNGWNNTDVTAHFDCADSLSGVESVTEDKIIATEGLDQSITGVCVDMASNSVDAIISGINIDKTPPVITNNIPIDGVEYLLSQNIVADWLVADALSGIESAAGTVNSGQAIDTSSVGVKTFDITSSDKAGNQTTRMLNYYVRYNYSGVLSPIKSDGSKFFKFGSTVPIKFQLKDSNGNFISISNAYIYVNKVSDSVSGLEEVVSAGEANDGNLFRYDIVDNQYIFNLGTKNLSIGTWQLSIKLDDETINKVNLSLKQ